MISVKEALEIVLHQSVELETEEIDILNATDRVLAENIYADRDFPPFNRVAMDGIAIVFDEYVKGQRQFKVEAQVAAGDAVNNFSNSKNCVEIMTGASIPEPFDTVIPYEVIEINNGLAIINAPTVKKGHNVHKKGTDRKKGDLLLPVGTLIAAPEIGCLATVGAIKVKVKKLPKVIFFSTGNELVNPQEIPASQQIRMSNNYTIHSYLLKYGINVIFRHLQDDPEVIFDEIEFAKTRFDVIMFSGGVSKGRKDYVPEILERLGTKKFFHRVRQKPGKPFWFGKLEKVTVFAFPGNPVSTFICLLKYFIPWLEKSLYGKCRNGVEAILKEEIEFKNPLTYFPEVRLKFKGGNIEAYPVKSNGSGDLASLLRADAFIELSEEKNLFKKGEVYKIIPFRDLCR